jgi:hypothetical protein
MAVDEVEAKVNESEATAAAAADRHGPRVRIVTVHMMAYHTNLQQPSSVDGGAQTFSLCRGTFRSL